MVEEETQNSDYFLENPAETWDSYETVEELIGTLEAEKDTSYSILYNFVNDGETLGSDTGQMDAVSYVRVYKDDAGGDDLVVESRVLDDEVVFQTIEDVYSQLKSFNSD